MIRIINLTLRYSSFGEIFVKFGKFFKRKKEHPESARARGSEETLPPEETIACPYCGHKYWKKCAAISFILVGKQNVPEWMGRFHCSGGLKTAGCGRDFWIVGSYGEIRYTKPF
jgi:hypothetical protein